MQEELVRAVLFDADGVVQRTGAGWQHALAALCPDNERVEAFRVAVFAAERPCLSGTADFREALTGVLEAFGSTVSVDEALRVWTQIEPVAEVLGVVRGLRMQGLVAALATNQQAYRAAFMSDRLGYRDAFDHLFYSCELGHAKPSSGFFEAVLERLALRPPQVLFLDDHPDNVAAARQIGLKAEVFDADQGPAALSRLLAARGVRVG